MRAPPHPWRDGGGLRLIAGGVVGVGLVLPILAGLWQTARAAFGVLPALGATQPSLAPWRALWALPGMRDSLRLTLVTGIGATVAALLLALALCAGGQGRLPRRSLAPLLATPHAAMAIGLGFLIAPSGWIVRLISPWLTGWSLPPLAFTVGDPAGLSLILGLLVKEVPFLLLVMAAALAQLPVEAQMATARAMGYGRGTAWLKVILPQLYPLIRLPVYVVLAFSLSVVDMAIILGPSNPPTLAVAVLRWFASPDLSRMLPAFAGALLQGAVVLTGIALWRAVEWLITQPGRIWITRGGRGNRGEVLLRALALLARGLIVLGGLALAVLLIWSLTWRWRFPHALPDRWSLHAWAGTTADWGTALANTLVIGAAATGLSLLLAVAWLEGADRAARPGPRRAMALIYLPLLLPQIGFLYGLDVVFLRVGIGPGMAAVIWAQALFVFPYVMIALSDPWRALDPRLTISAAALGAGPWGRLFRVKLPVLLRPLLTAAAVGFAVSVAQYLPTLFMGAGRIATLTTEAVTLSSGSDRRITAVYAVLQAALPLLAFGAALGLPGMVHRNRRGLAGGSTV